MQISSLERPRWVPYHGQTVSDVLRHNGSHSDRNIFANVHPWTNASASANVRARSDSDVAITANPRRKGHKVTDDAVVRYVAVDVALEELTDLCVTGYHREIANDRSGSNFHIGADQGRGCNKSTWPASDTLCNFAPGLRTSKSNQDFVGVSDLIGVNGSGFRVIGSEDHVAIVLGNLETPEERLVNLATEAAGTENDDARYHESMMLLCAGTCKINWCARAGKQCASK